MNCIYCDGELSRVIIVNTFLTDTIERYRPGLYVFECIGCKRKTLFEFGWEMGIRGTVREWNIDSLRYKQEIFIEDGELIIWDEIKL